MSRILARSIVADVIARLCNALLLLLLAPLILVLARRIPRGPTRTVPFSAPMPGNRMTEPS